MLLNRENLATFIAGIAVTWDDAKKAVKTTFREWAMVVDNKDVAEVNYSWLEDLGFPEEWIGPRKRKNFRAQKIKVIHKPYEKTVEVKTEDLRRDTYGQYAGKIRNMYSVGEQMWQKLCEQLEATVFTAVGYDGQFISDTDHPKGPDGATTWSNKTTDLLDYDALWDAIANANAIPMPEGEEMVDVTPYELVIAPGLLKTATELLTLDTKPGGNGEKNALKEKYGNIKIRVNARLAVKQWILTGKFAGDASLSHVGLSIEMEPTLSTPDPSGFTETVVDGVKVVGKDQFENRAIPFGTEQWGSAFWTMPQLIIYASDGSGS